MSICILGRQPAIGRAELESLYGADALGDVSPNIVRVDAELDIVRLGGTIKTAVEINEINSLQLRDIIAACKKLLPRLIADYPEGKIKCGLSFYGLEQNIRTINAAGLELKKIMRASDRSVRIVPNQSPEMSSAQTLHNHLASPLGLELAFIRNGSKTIIARVTGVQDIDSYTLRDRGRPQRDTRVGMLPPKLAQIIINLATGHLTTSVKQVASAIAEDSAFPAVAKQDKNNQLALSGSEANDRGGLFGQKVILDPFCGTGVVLQEAALMGYSVYGSDIEERMVRYTRDNLNWLFETFRISAEHYYEIADATDHTWRPPIDFVACEGYLGTPFASEPPEEALRNSIQTCNLIMKKFLRTIHGQLAPGSRLCIAAPSWHVRGKTYHLSMCDEIETLGYTRHTFRTARDHELLYRREDQIVGRELLVLTVM